jgi:hypothetical protein
MQKQLTIDSIFKIERPNKLNAKEEKTWQIPALWARHRDVLAKAPWLCSKSATSETVQLCLMPVRYDQYPKDRETDRVADQAESCRDPLQHSSAEKRVGRFDFRV